MPARITDPRFADCKLEVYDKVTELVPSEQEQEEILAYALRSAAPD